MECHNAGVSCKILTTGDKTIGADSAEYKWTQEDTKMTQDIIDNHYHEDDEYEQLPEKLRNYLEGKGMGKFFGSVRKTKRNPTKHSPDQGRSFGYICF